MSNVSMKSCPYCGESIMSQAVKCKHCGEFLDAAARPMVVVQQPAQQGNTSGLLAALLSFFIPGLGQLCQGRVLAGLIWFVVCFVGYLALVIPGVILHIWCIYDAATKR